MVEVVEPGTTDKEDKVIALALIVRVFPKESM